MKHLLYFHNWYSIFENKKSTSGSSEGKKILNMVRYVSPDESFFATKLAAEWEKAGYPIGDPDDKEFKKFALKLATPEQWMSIFPYTMAKFFDPKYTKYPNLYKKWKAKKKNAKSAEDSMKVLAWSGKASFKDFGIVDFSKTSDISKVKGFTPEDEKRRLEAEQKSKSQHADSEYKKYEEDKKAYDEWVNKWKAKEEQDKESPLFPGGILKSFYYNVIKQGKSCDMSSKGSKDEAFLAAKKEGCNYFSWNDNWYNAETDMPISQEIKAYSDKSIYPVVVDCFNMGQEAAGGGFGHLQSWSLDEPKYQINAMPEKADIDKVLLGGIGDAPGGGPPEYQQTMYNQVCSELNNLKKESIVIKMTKEEYERYKKIVGDWAQKKVKDVSTAVIGASKKSYNLLFSNCTDHTVRSAVLNPDATSLTLPILGYKLIKLYYSGRYEERKEGVRIMNIEGRLDISVPSEYEDPKYVIKNAETIVANKWTVIVQETLWNQKDEIKKLIGKNPNAQSAVTAIDLMNAQSRKKDGKWDRTFSKGRSTDKALQAVRKLVESGYNPVSVDWKDFFKNK